MAGHERRFIAQRPQLGGNGFHQIVEIALGEISAADAALKQHIAHNGELRWRVVKHDMAGRVAGAVIDIQHQLAHRHLVAIVQPSVGRERFRARHAIGGTLGRVHVDPEFVIGVGAFDRHPQITRQHSGEAAMIDMAVGDEQLLDGDAIVGGDLLQPIEIAARIGEGAAHGFRAPQQGTILLERRDRHDNGLQGRLGCHAAISGESAGLTQVGSHIAVP